MRHIIGISIGGTKSAVCYASLEGQEIISIEKKQIPTNPLDPNKEIEELFELINSYPQDFDFISVVAGSPMDANKGIICQPSNLPGWIDVPIVSLLKERYKVPCVLLNDADAGVLAEYHYGAGKGSTNFVYIIMGTGFGSGIVINERLYRGSNNNAGECGHVKVSDEGYMPRNKKPGSAEGFISGGGIEDEAKMLSKYHPSTSLAKIENITGKVVFEEARKGDELASLIVQQCARKLGEVISIYLDILNPDRIVIGGIYPRAVDLLEKEVLSVVKQSSLKESYECVSIVPSALAEKIDDYSSLMGIYL